MEWHVRDVFAEGVERGLVEDEAFAAAVRRVGNERRLRRAFKKDWGERSLVKRYWLSLKAEFKGWATRRALVGYALTRALSFGAAVYLAASLFWWFSMDGIPVWYSVTTVTYLGCGFLFNVLPFKRWASHWTDWTRLTYAAIVLGSVWMILTSAPTLLSGSDARSAMGTVSLLVIGISIRLIGPVLWLNQVFRLRTSISTSSE